ncbi:MAG: AAA family ATPase [Saprospiraceae bacterium]|nr:AAA family ATPase [Saprospiraceae bacterium]
MDTKLIGRVKELGEISKYHSEKRSHFVAVYGRRRVGKTFLIRKAFDDQFTFYTTGIARGSLKEQLATFTLALKKYFKDETISMPNTWIDAFAILINKLEVYPSQKKVIFLDELPWMDQRNSKFINALEYFWNSWASGRSDILLIVCGSSASWMINKLIKNKGGLYNRVTGRIKLNPFTLYESKQYLESLGCQYDEYQCIQTYMCFGGIPFYLSHFNKDMSASQNINQLCFAENALFKNEYYILYQSLFDNPGNHMAVIEAIANKNKGIQRAEIVKRSGITDGGGLTRILIELEESGFIRKYYNFKKISREVVYQLTDLFSLFHLSFLGKPQINDENIWLNMINTPKQNTWSGYAYEILCILHIYEIKRALGIDGILSNISTWQNKNAQIDLIIDRSDNVINVIEIKFSNSEFTITKDYDKKLRNKIHEFKESTKTRKALWLVMLTTFGLKNGPYNGLVQKSITSNIFFRPLL